MSTVTDIGRYVTANPVVRSRDHAMVLGVGSNHRRLVETLRSTAQRRTRVRVWVRRTTSWI